LLTVVVVEVHLTLEDKALVNLEDLVVVVLFIQQDLSQLEHQHSQVLLEQAAPKVMVILENLEIMVVVAALVVLAV